MIRAIFAIFIIIAIVRVRDAAMEGKCPTAGEYVSFNVSNNRHPDGFILNLKNEQELSGQVANMNATSRTIVIINDLYENLDNTNWPYAMREAYLILYPNSDVIVVDWTKFIKKSPDTAPRCAPLVGEHVGKFLVKMNTTYGFSVKKVHIVAFSLGGQLASIAGQIVLEQLSTRIGRITGLDVSLMTFRFRKSERRLNSNDADIVVGYHTDLFYGYPQSYGRVDYFITGNSTNCPSAPQSLQETAMCLHYKVLDIKMASLRNDSQIYAYYCNNPPMDCDYADNTLVADELDNNSWGRFYVNTEE